MKAVFNISDGASKQFKRSCEVAIISIGSATKEACTEAAQEIMMESMNQVPRDTGTLASSAFVGVSKRVDTSTSRYGAILGYGSYNDVGSMAGLGSEESIEWFWPPTNPINPRNKMRASAYAASVHENLNRAHKGGGKAKFLEDPVRTWASGKFDSLMAEYWALAIERTTQFTESRISNKAIVRLVKKGVIEQPKFPVKPNINNFKSIAEFDKAWDTYVQNARAYDVIQRALSNPTRGYSRGYKSTKDIPTNYIPMTRTSYTPQKQYSITYKGKK